MQCLMICNYNMFDIESQVYKVQNDQETVSIFKGNFEELTNFMAEEYQRNDYNKIILTGPYAEVLEQRIRTYSQTRFNNNFKELNIEIA